MHSLLLDLRAAARFFHRRRVASAAAVFIVGLALAANTAVFSVLKTFLSSNLGVPEPERLHQIFSSRDLPGRGTVDFYNAWPATELVAAEAGSFSAVGALQFGDFVWHDTGEGEPRRLLGARAAASTFVAWNIRPALGRFVRADEEGAQAAPVVVISHRLWRSHFNAAPEVLARVMRLNGVPHTIVGVMPAGFSQPPETDVWLPLEATPDLRARGFGPKLFVLYGRLGPGVTGAAALDELRRLTARADEIDPAANRGWRFTSKPLREVLLDGSDRAIWLVQVGALVLLLLAIVNLASLQLAWAAERQTETAVRLAIGAPAARVFRLFLTQSLLLCTLGGGLGVLLAWLALPVWQALNPAPDLAFLLADLELDGGTLAFSAALVLVTGVAAGVLPAVQARSAPLIDALKGGARGSSASRGNLAGQKAIAIIQSAVTVLVLSSAVLLGWSYRNLDRVPRGFATEDRAVFRVQLPAAAYPGGADRARFALRWWDEAQRQPEIASAGITTTLPVDDVRQVTAFGIEDAHGGFPVEEMPLHSRGIAPGYLAAMGIPLRQGRDLTRADLAPDAAKVALISQAAAEKFWPHGSAIGRRVRRVSGKNVDVFAIAGVVANVQDAGARHSPGETIYLPLQHSAPRKLSVVLHGRTGSAGALAAGRQALQAADPTLAVFGVARLDELAGRANALARLQTVLVSVFAFAAGGIAMLGTYGIMGQLVASRTREFAVRLALGADRGRLVRATLRQNARLGLIGALGGAAASWFLGEGLRAKLFGVGGHAPAVYAVVVAATLLLLQLAALPPALKCRRLEIVRHLTGD